jgi:predicted O-methyltransferase YrrM
MTIEGWFDFELIYNEAVNLSPNNATFVEIGCWLGQSTAYLAHKIKQSKKNIHLICVDTWAGSQGADLKSDNIHHDFLKLHNGNIFPAFKKNMTELGLFNLILPLQGKSVDIAKFFTAEQIDFIFIDAAHDYQSVTNDIVSWKPKMKPNGIMAGHDFDWPGVNRAVREQFSKFEIIKGNCSNSWRVMLKPKLIL